MHAESVIDLSPHTKHNYTYYKISIINADQIPGMLLLLSGGRIAIVHCNCMHSLPIKEEVELSV